jgi:magnesium transporter
MQVTFVDTIVTVGSHPTHESARDSVQHGKPGGGGGGSVAGNSSKLRKWISVTPGGMAATLELSKVRVHHELGIQLRDLRLLDPMLASSYPSAVLARDRALVVNLEFIKMIITLDRVFITNLDDPNTNMFIEELQRRLKHPAGSATAMGVTPSTASLGALLNNGQQQQQNSSTDSLDKHANNIPSSATSTNQHQQHHQPLPSSLHPSHPSHAVLSSVHHPDLGPHFEELSFDLRVLECALDVVSGYLESQTADLEAAAHPALDALTQKISTSNLERVRRIKNRMVRLVTRAETLKELLAKILDDDSDMKDLNLTAKEVEREELVQRQSLRHSMSLSNSTPFDVPIPIHHRNNSFMAPPLHAGAVPDATTNLNGATTATTNLPAAGGATNIAEPPPPFGTTTNMMNQGMNTKMMMRALSYKAQAENDDNSSDDTSDEGVEVVEQLVEAYFMMVDNTCSKLQTLAEYIDDTEDFINIELDSHRNQLIRLDLVLTSATASIALITAVTSLFAMNVTLSPDFEDKAPYSWFVTIAVSSSVLAIVVFAAVMAYCRYKRLI